MFSFAHWNTIKCVYITYVWEVSIEKKRSFYLVNISSYLYVLSYKYTSFILHNARVQFRIFRRILFIPPCTALSVCKKRTRAIIHSDTWNALFLIWSLCNEGAATLLVYNVYGIIYHTQKMEKIERRKYARERENWLYRSA